MPSSGRHILDIKQKGPSRAKARGKMTPMFSRPSKPTPKTPRPQRLRDKRRKQRILVGCICLLSTLGMIGGVGAISHIERLAINDVSVVGAAAIQPAAVSAAVQDGLTTERFKLFSRENMFLYPKHALEAKLTNEFPRIKDVSLSRPSMLAQAVVVAVEERSPYAKWCANTCYLLDSTGFVFAEFGNESPEIAYTFGGGLADNRSPIGQWFLRGRLPSMVEFVQQLGAAGFTAKSLTVDTEKDFTVLLDSGVALYVPFDADPETILRNLKTTIESDSLQGLETLQYIDLRFGSRVYYK